MKTFILDGYNVIHKMPEMAKNLTKSLETARRMLAVYLSGWRKRYPDAEILIVFDGKDNDFYTEENTRISGVRCIFTRSGETADERIISVIRHAKAPREITVITEDNSIRNSSRAHGAEVKNTDFLLPRRNKTIKRTKGMDKVTPPANLSRVTDYYEEHLRETGKI